MHTQRTERRLAELEARRTRYWRLGQLSDVDLLAIIGWHGDVPPTDAELRAIAHGRMGGGNEHAH